MAGLSLRRNFAWTLASNVVYAVCLWGQLALLTKLGDPATVGRFALASAVATPAFVFAHLQLRAVLASDARGTHDFRDYLGVRIALVIPAFLISALFGLVAYQPGQALAIGLFAVGRVAEAMSDVFYGYEQKHERLDLISISMMIKGVVALSAFGLVFAMTRNLNWGLFANALAWTLPLVVFDIPSSRRLAREHGNQSLRPRWDRRAAMAIVALAWPLGLAMLCIQMRVTLPRTLLEANQGEQHLGIFSALSYLSVAGATVIASLSQTIIARLGRFQADQRVDLMRRLTTRMLVLTAMFGLAGVAIAWLAGAPLLRLIYSEEYAVHSSLLVLVMAEGALQYLGSILGAPATAMRLFRPQLAVHVGSVVILAGTGLWLVPRHGAPGAIAAMMFGSLWVIVGYGWIVRGGFRALASGAAGRVA